MEELLDLILKTYGIVGLLIAAPFVALVFLWKDYKRISTQLSAIEKARVEDAQKITDKLIQMVEEQSGLNKETNLTLTRVGEVLATIPTRHDGRR